MFPLSIIYGSIQLLLRKLYQLKILTSYQSKIKIISVGNIVSGGTGKTPFTMFLAEFLLKNNKKIAISHRGYKGNFEDENRLISDRNNLFEFANMAGDEAYLIAQKLIGIPVIVGKNRTQSVKKLEETYPDLDFIILDDSFQHHKVKHYFDFLIFNSISKIGNKFVLPAGILREPISTIKFCDALIINGKNSDFIEKYKLNKPVFKTKYSLKKIYNKKEETISKNYFLDKKIMLLSGIGLPSSFEKSISENGIIFSKHFVLSDHKNYSQKLLQQIQEEYTNGNFEAIITTEKDFAKLKHVDNSLNLFVFQVHFQMENFEKFDKYFKDFL